MSLINDALKRAQRDRTSHAQAPLPHAPGASSLRPAGRSGPPWLLIGLGATIGGLFALVAVLLLRPSAPASAPIAAAAPLAAPATPPPATQASAAVASPPAVTLPVSLTSTETPSAATSTAATLTADPVRATAATAPLVIPSVPAPVAATPAGPARPTPRLIQAVEALRVTGIRAAGADSKVLMNDRVYRVGDIVDHELQIRLTAATAQSLTFVDETGASYTRNFN